MSVTVYSVVVVVLVVVDDRSMNLAVLGLRVVLSSLDGEYGERRRKEKRRGKEERKEEVKLREARRSESSVLAERHDTTRGEQKE